MSKAKKMAQDIQRVLQQSGNELNTEDLTELESCCDLFLLMADEDKTHDKQLEEASLTLRSIVNDLSFQNIEGNSVAVSFWKVAAEIAKPIAREALTTLTKAALEVALQSFKA